MSDHRLDAMRFVLIAQKKRHSMLEAVLNTAIGFAVSFVAGLIIYPYYGITATQAIMSVTLIFTVLSVVRQYFVRRFFNYLHEKGYL